MWYTHGMLHISKSARTYPQLPYNDMKEAILGKKYELSLTFVGKVRARALNTAYRKATYVPNVLSFPLSSDAGEIYIAPSVAEREAHKFNLSPRGYIGFLFIHGLLHLKGHLHGDTMEKAEQKYRARFKLK